MKTIQDMVAIVNRKTNTNITVHGKGEFDEKGHFAGHLLGGSPEELQRFLGYIASSRGRDFDRVEIRYGTRNPPTFTCYVKFNRDDIGTSPGQITSPSSRGCLLLIMASVAVPFTVVYVLASVLAKISSR